MYTYILKTYYIKLILKFYVCVKINKLVYTYYSNYKEQSFYKKLIPIIFKLFEMPAIIHSVVICQTVYNIKNNCNCNNNNNYL